MLGKLILVLGFVHLSTAISCQNQYNYDVPWFAAYKFPKMAGEPSDSADGYGFYYLDSTSKSTFKPSAVSLKLPHNAIGYTLDPYYTRMKDTELLHVFYNDEPALNNSQVSELIGKISGAASVETGHTKGVLLFDQKQGSGIWLIHSVPKFPPADKYIYPATGTDYGQQFLCLTLDVNTLTQLGTVLYYNHPDVYSSRVPDWASKLAPDLVKVINKQYNSDPANTHLKQALAVKGAKEKMDVFAKTHLFNDDLWAGLVAPAYGSMEVETWRRGDLIDTVCKSPNPVYDAQEVKVGGSAEFKYTKDHSKYGRTLDAKNKVVCIGDINRMTSQYARGGGTVCITDADLWNAYNVITEIPKC